MQAGFLRENDVSVDFARAAVMQRCPGLPAFDPRFMRESNSTAKLFRHAMFAGLSLILAGGSCSTSPQPELEGDAETPDDLDSNESNATQDDDDDVDDDDEDGSESASDDTNEDESDVSDDPACEGNAKPDAPNILEPAAGRMDIRASELSMLGSAFADENSDDKLHSIEAEIWSYAGGTPIRLEWSANVETSKVKALTLEDGVFEPGVDPEFLPWSDYRLRMRYRDLHVEGGETCSRYSDWSEDRIFRSDDGSSPLFDESVIRSIYLDIPDESWQAIDAQAIPPACEPFFRDYHSGTLTIEDEVFDGVGIKIKGGCGSARTLEGKAAFKINLEWDDPEVEGCGPEREFMGVKTFTLNNGVQDKSAMHDRLGYSIYRALGLPAARSAHVRLYVNGEFWGLYTHVETINRRFLRRWFGSEKGDLYEGTYWCDLVSENIPPDEEPTTKFCLSSEFSDDECEDLRAARDLQPLRAMVEELNRLKDEGFYPEIRNLFDYDRYLRTWALESVISHWDGYVFQLRNNYRVYQDPTDGRWTVISSGIDQTFVEDQHPWDTQAILGMACLQNQQCEQAFVDELKATNAAVKNLDLPAMAQAIYDQIAPVVDEDPRKEYSMAEFDAEFESLLDFLEYRHARIDEYLDEHENGDEEEEEEEEDEEDEEEDSTR
jgi:spore coat protein CotH